MSAWAGQLDSSSKTRVGLSKESSVMLFSLHCRHTTKEKLGRHQCRVSSTQILEHRCYVWICLSKLTPGSFLHWSWSSTRSVLSQNRVRHTGMSPCLFWASHAHLTDFSIPKLSLWLESCWNYMSGIKNPKVVLQKWKKKYHINFVYQSCLVMPSLDFYCAVSCWVNNSFKGLLKNRSDPWVSVVVWSANNHLTSHIMSSVRTISDTQSSLLTLSENVSWGG